MGRLSFWLKNGVRASWTPDAWEFTDPRTGERHRCLHPRGAVADPWVEAFETDHAVFFVVRGQRTKELARWRVWRSAPELAEAQGFDVVVEEPLAERESWRPRVSPDGRWLLFSEYRQHRHWLHSLADGSGYRLEGMGGDAYAMVSFTADSSRLVAVGWNELGVWDLAEKRWRTTLPVPPSMCGTMTAGIAATVSPAYPWRVALRWVAEPRLYVADPEDGTVREVFSKETRPRSFPRLHDVSWLGGDRLLVEQHSPDYQLWVVDANGTDARQVLP